jgi:hypothetical protein
MKIHTRLKMIILIYLIFIIKSNDASTQGIEEFYFFLNHNFDEYV